MRSAHHRAAALAVGALAVLTASACSNDSSTTTSEATSAMSSAVSSVMSTTAPTTPAAAPAGALIGSGCAAYAEQVPTGPGSVEGMSMDPVTVAASNNPLLTTFTQAVSGGLNPDVDLVETLNGSEFTVFAPTDDAFAKLDAATIDTLKTDSDLLTSILTYHVVPGQAGPAQVAGEHKTVQGDSVTVTGAGDTLKVNDAGLVCGGVKTANATVYLIDTVLIPPAA